MIVILTLLVMEKSCLHPTGSRKTFEFPLADGQVDLLRPGGHLGKFKGLYLVDLHPT
jgi:hypothetical protein